MTRAPPWSSEPLRRKTEPHRRGSVGLLENPEWQMYDRREGRRINRGERKRRKCEEVSRQTEEGEEKQRCTWKRRRINKSIPLLLHSPPLLFQMAADGGRFDGEITSNHTYTNVWGQQDFFMFLKDVSYAHQGCSYSIQKSVSYMNI